MKTMRELILRNANSVAVTGLNLFGGSIAFPIIASLISVENLPNWIGILDMGIAFTLILLMLTLSVLMQNLVDDQIKLQCYRIYSWLANLIIVLLVIFFLFGDAIRWNILLPGLAWRAWLFTYSLPALLVMLLNKTPNP